MSWIYPTLLFVLACLLVAFGVTEWIVKRRKGGNDGDRDSLV